MDIRDKPVINHADVVGLNFMRDTQRYYFRRYHMNGLRSHVMEVLDPGDLDREIHGVLVDGVRRFPKARPIKMLRIFRQRFAGMDEVLAENRGLKLIQRYLGRAHLAVSNEFIVEYRPAGHCGDILLCGLQEYVDGVALDPWTHMGTAYTGFLVSQLMELGGAGNLGTVLRRNLEDFVDRLKRLILTARHVPDLAGVRNILVTPQGRVKLVDINNISAIARSGCLLTDDFGYPVCDKSVEALSLIEKNMLGRKIGPADPVYRDFLDPDRMKEVARLDRAFYEKTGRPQH